MARRVAALRATSALTGAALASSALMSGPAWALPQGGTVVEGDATITYSDSSVVIEQSSAHIIIEWDSFDTAAGESVHFDQAAFMAALNRILSGEATRFDGALTAGGSITIVNAAGIAFGAGSTVDVGAITATTLDILNANFMADQLVFDQYDQAFADASVTNNGRITVADQGLAALVGPGVANNGVIQARTGAVVLASGTAATIDFYGDGLVNFALTGGTEAAPVDADGNPLDALVTNAGAIYADGGTVILRAESVGDIVDNAINMGGIIQARSIEGRGGQIALIAGDGAGAVQVAGTLDASAADTDVAGGVVHVLGDQVALNAGADIDVSGPAGGGEVLVGGAYQGGALDAADAIAGLEPGVYQNTSDVTYFDAGATVAADATDSGDGGTVIVWGDDTTYFAGVISARGGANGGDGGFVETSGAGRLGVAASASVDALAANGAVGDWLLDPRSVTVAAAGAATLAQIADASDTTSDLTVAVAIINAATANVSIVASETITFDSAVSISASGVGLTAQAGNRITVNASVATNNGDINLVSDEFVINAAVDAGTGTVMFDTVAAETMGVGLTPGVATAGADLDTAELALISAGSLVFGDPTAAQNSITDLRLQSFPANANIAGLVQFNALGSASAFILAFSDQTYAAVEFNANDGVEFGGNQTITTTAGDAVFNVDVDATGPVGGFDDLRADDTYAVSINSAADIVVTTPRITETGTGTITFNANSGAGTITFRRSNAGTIGVGDGAGGDFTVGNDQLARMTAATVNFGDPTTPNNTTAIAVSGVTSASVATIGTVAFNTGGTTTFSGANGFAAVATSGATTAVATGATVAATDTIAFNTSTVTLDGNLTATNGITGTASIVNVLGSAGGAELQDAVDVAAAGATVNVSPGTYAGFTIDVDNLTIDGFNSPMVNAASPAVTIAANGVTVQDLLLQGTGTAGEVGILLDGTAAPGLTGINIVNVDFSKLDDGIRSQGDIGIGAAADVTIRGTSDADKSVFEDFLDAAIDVGDTDGDATYVIQDVIVRDGAADGDTAGTGGDGMRFGAVGGITVDRVDISGATGDGIQFGALDGATVTISNSSIVGALDDTGSGSGLNFDGFITNGSQISIADNSRIESLGGLHGIEFEQAPTGTTTTIDIANNTLIQSAENQGIVFARGATDVTVIIRGNGTDASNGIRGPQDAISVNNAVLTNVTFIVGGDTAADGNFVVSSTQALDIEGVDGGRFVVANNDLLQGSVAFEMEGAVANGAEVILVNNGDISSTGVGAQFRGSVTAASTVTIAGNVFTDTDGSAIQFLAGQSITDSTVTIGSATVTVEAADDVVAGGNTMDGSGSGSGIDVRAAVDGDTDFAITDNAIGTGATRVGVDGIAFTGGILGTATVTIGSGNTVFATQQAIQVDDLQSPTTLSIVGGTYDGTGGALLVDNTGVAGTDGTLNVGAAAYVGGAGSTVFEVLTDAGNAGVDIDFSGAATFDGGATGIRLSGPGIDILNDTLGGIAFTGQTGNYIVLADGAEFLPGSPTIIDATAASFGGLIGSAMTLAQLLAVEDMLTHFPDDPTLGLIDIATLFVVQGESIQTAVNAAGLLAGPQTVFVGPGSFGGSVEIWVDALTIVGQGATTIIDTDAVDPFANNGDVDNGFQVAAISATSGGGDVSGVTIDGFAFTSGTAGANGGVELGEAGTSTAVDTTVENSTFTGLLHGIVGHDLGGTTTVRDNNDIEVAGAGILFTQALAGVVIDIHGNTIDAGVDGIAFAGALDDADVEIDGNDVSGDGDGIDVAGGISGGSRFAITNNARIVSAVDTPGVNDDAIAFEGAISGATTAIVIADNALIEGADRGIAFDELATITDASVTISGNTITSLDLDGILFDNALTNATVLIGGATDAGGNTIIGNDDGVDVDTITGGSFTLSLNSHIEGLSGDGVEFEGAISGSASIEVSGNREIEAAVSGITFLSTVTDSTVLIDRNGTATLSGADYDGTAAVDLATFVITGAISGTGGSAIAFADAIGGTSQVTVSRNMITDSGTAISFDSVGATGTTAVYNNFVLENFGDGIAFTGDIASPVEVFQNFIARNGDDGINVGPGAAVGAGNLFVQQNFMPGALFLDGNGGFGFNHQGTGAPDIEANWWGSTSIAGVASARSGVVLPTRILSNGLDTNVPAGGFGVSGLDPFAFQNQFVILLDPPDEPVVFDPEALLIDILSQTNTERTAGDVIAGRAGLTADNTIDSVFEDPFNIFGALPELAPASGGENCRLIPIEGGVRLTCTVGATDEPADLEPEAGDGSVRAPALDPGLTLEHMLDIWLQFEDSTNSPAADTSDPIASDPVTFVGEYPPALVAVAR